MQGLARGEYYINTYVCSNGVEEKTKFFVPFSNSDNGSSLTKRQRSSAIDRAAKSSSNATHECGRLLNCTFHPGDVLLGLDYSPEGYNRIIERANRIADTYIANEKDPPCMQDLIWVAANHECSLFIRRVQNALRATEIKLKYIFITSDMDGKTGELVRIHHHLVINKEALEVCLKKWNRGGCYPKRLKDQKDYHPIAEYLIKQVRYIRDQKRYTPSRNLERAQVGKPRKAINGAAELRVPRGAEILHRADYVPGKPQYMRYIRQFEDLEGGVNDRPT